MRPNSADEADRRDAAEIRRHGGWAVVGRALNAVTVLGLTAFLARVLGERDFADFNVLRTVLTLVGLAAASGLGTAALRATGEAVARDDTGAARRVAGNVVRLAIPIQLAVSLAAGVLVWRFGGLLFAGEATPTIAACVAVATLTMAALQVCAEILRGLGEPAAANLLGGLRGAPLLNSGLLLMIGAVALWSRATFTSAAIAYAATGLLLMGPAVWRVRQRVRTLPVEPASDAAAERRAMWQVAWPVALTALLTSAVTQLDQLIAPAAMGEAQSAAYVNARRVVIFAMFPLSVLNTTAAGLIGRMYFGGRRVELQAALQAGAALIGLPCLVFYAVAFVAPQVVVAVVLGPGYEACHEPLRWLVPGHLLITLTGSCGLALLLTGWQRAALVINGIGLAALLVGGPLAGRWGGSVAMAGFVSVHLGAASIAAWFVARRKAGLDTRARLTLLARPRKLKAALRPGHGASAPMPPSPNAQSPNAQSPNTQTPS